MSSGKVGKGSTHRNESIPPGDAAPLKSADGYAWQSLLNAADDLEQAARTIAAILSQHLEYDFFEINMLDISTGVLSPYRVHSPTLDTESAGRLLDGYRLGQGFTGWLVENRTPLLIEDLHNTHEFKPAVDHQSLPLHSYLGLPIHENGDLIGTIEIAHQEVGKYTQDDIETFGRVRDAVALKLANLQKTRDLQATRLLAGIQRELLDQIKHFQQPDRMVSGLGDVILEHFEVNWLSFLIYNPGSKNLETIPPRSSQAASGIYQLTIPSPPTSAFSSIWNTQDYWIVNHLQEDELVGRMDLGNDLEAMDVERFMLAPLIAEEDRFGIILLGSGINTKPFGEEQGALLGMIASVCGPLLKFALEGEQNERNEIERSRSHPQRSSYTNALLQITGELAASMDLDHLLIRVLTMLRQSVGADQGAFLLTAPDTDVLILRASSGSFPAPPPGGRATSFRAGQGLAGWVIQNRIAVCIGDLSDDERWVPFDDESPKQHSALVAPLIVSEQILGVVVLLGHVKHAFTDTDLELVSVAANQIAPAIHNAQLYHLIQDQAERLGLALRTHQVEASQSQAVLHAMTDGVIVTDPSHRILVFNPAAELILGMPRTEMLGQPVFEIFSNFGESGKEINEQLQTWRDRGASARSRNLPPRRIHTEQSRVLAVQPAPVVLGDDFLGTITIVRDITRDVEVDRMKSEFVATVSHELRSPITPIKGFVDLMRMGVPGEITEEQAHYLEIIYKNIHRLEMLVDDLLDISRIEAGKVVLSFQALNIEQLLDELEKYIDHRSKTEGKQMAFQATMEADLPDIWGDAERVRQILTSLVDNSFDYTPEGGNISVEAHQVEDQVEIAVGDNGMGIAVDEQEKIFERFYRGEQALIMGVAGAGLGLSIALTMVEMHGGRIWVNSAGIPGKGSTFTVSLPITTPNSKPEKVVRKQ